MSTPINVGPGGNAGGYGVNNNLGASTLEKYGIGASGSTVTPSMAGLGALSSGNTVYMGIKAAPTKLGPGPYAPGYKPPKGPITGVVADTLSYEEARGLPLKWAREDPNKLRDFVNKGILNKVPGFSVDMGIMEIASAWDDMVKASMEFTKASGSNWSPYDVMDTYQQSAGKFGTEKRGDWVYDIATNKPVKYVGPTKKTTTEKRVNLSSPDDVRALTLQMLRELLGRNPTGEELTQFQSSINTMEQASPQITTTTTELRPNLATGEVEAVGSESVTMGGVSQGAMQTAIEEDVVKTPEYAKYQGGTTYFNALLQMIGGG